MPKDVNKLSKDDMRRLAGRLRLYSGQGSPKGKTKRDVPKTDLAMAADVIDKIGLTLFGEQSYIPFSSALTKPTQDVETGDKL